MARKGLRKLVDIAEGSVRLQAALENFLHAHHIAFDRHDHGDGFARYYVASKDLCCAQSVLPALRQLAEGGES